MASPIWSPRSDDPTVLQGPEPARNPGCNVQAQPRAGHAPNKPGTEPNAHNRDEDQSDAGTIKAMNEHDFAHLGSQFDAPENVPERRPKSKHSHLAARL